MVDPSGLKLEGFILDQVRFVEQANRKLGSRRPRQKPIFL
jgi:hypothetical protein